MQEKTKPRVLLFDIETAPNIAYIWRLWTETTNMEMVESDWYVLCWCAKWLDEDRIYVDALPFHKELYKADKTNDRLVLESLRGLLDQADIVVAHNAIKFDVKKVNTRLVYHRLSPPAPFKVVDTLYMAKRYFSFTSNKLNDLGVFLGVGQKEETGGFQLWKDCLAGKKDAWKKMVKYCAGDVKLLEQVYYLLAPFSPSLPNFGAYMDGPVCARCGSTNLIKQGFAYTNLSKFQRWQCKDCGAWSRSRKRERPDSAILNVAK